MSDTRTIFVYGTLRRGQCRERCWPRPPLSVQAAFVRGRLLCLGAFPGLIVGNDWVRGEAWQLHPRDVAETLRVLDQIEGYQPAKEANQYDRIEAEFFSRTDTAAIGRAILYRLADPQLRQAGKPIAPQPGEAGQTYAEWSAPEA